MVKYVIICILELSYYTLPSIFPFNFMVLRVYWEIMTKIRGGTKDEPKSQSCEYDSTSVFTTIIFKYILSELVYGSAQTTYTHFITYNKNSTIIYVTDVG